METGKLKIIGLSAVAVLLLVVIGFWAKNGWYDKGKSGVVVSDKLPEGYSTKTPEPGNIPEGFPAGLIFLADSRVVRAEDTIVGSGDNHKIVELEIPQTMDAVLSYYVQMLTNNNWQSRSQSQTQEFASVTYSKDKNTVKITITPVSGQAGSSNVRIAYIIPK